MGELAKRFGLSAAELEQRLSERDIEAALIIQDELHRAQSEDWERERKKWQPR